MTTRRDVLRGLTGLVAAGAVPVTVVACGGDDDSAPMDSAVDSMTSNTCGSTVQNIGHTHSLSMQVTKADVAAGVEKSYLLSMSSGHTHGLTISAASFATLSSTGMVVVPSDPGGAGPHMHNVTVTCSA